MTQYLVTCVIEDDNNIAKQVAADSPKEAIDIVAVQYGSTDLLVFEDGYKTEFVKSSKIIKFIVINLDEKEKVDNANAATVADLLDSIQF